MSPSIDKISPVAKSEAVSPTLIQKVKSSIKRRFRKATEKRKKFKQRLMNLLKIAHNADPTLIENLCNMDEYMVRCASSEIGIHPESIPPVKPCSLDAACPLAAMCPCVSPFSKLARSLSVARSPLINFPKNTPCLIDGERFTLADTMKFAPAQIAVCYPNTEEQHGGETSTISSEELTRQKAVFRAELEKLLREFDAQDEEMKCPEPENQVHEGNVLVREPRSCREPETESEPICVQVSSTSAKCSQEFSPLESTETKATQVSISDVKNEIRISRIEARNKAIQEKRDQNKREFDAWYVNVKAEIAAESKRRKYRRQANERVQRALNWELGQVFDEEKTWKEFFPDMKVSQSLFPNGHRVQYEKVKVFSCAPVSTIPEEAVSETPFPSSKLSKYDEDVNVKVEISNQGQVVFKHLHGSKAAQISLPGRKKEKEHTSIEVKGALSAIERFKHHRHNYFVDKQQDAESCKEKGYLPDYLYKLARKKHLEKEPSDAPDPTCYNARALTDTEVRGLQRVVAYCHGLFNEEGIPAQLIKNDFDRYLFQNPLGFKYFNNRHYQNFDQWLMFQIDEARLRYSQAGFSYSIL